MRKIILIIAILVAIAAISFAQAAPPAPPAPVAPESSTVPKAPKAPRAPRAPGAPRAPEGWNRGSYLGVDTRDITPERMGALKLKNDSGVEILMVDADAPAGKAGLKEHDVILSYNGKQVQDQGQLRSMIRDTKPGTKVNLGISRDGQQINVAAQLTARHSSWSGQVIRIPKIEIPPMPEIDVPSFAMLQYSRRNGLIVENLTRQLGEFFGAKEGKGVLVRSVEKNSLAESAGFKAGDVIIRVGSEPVENMSDWNQIIRSQQAGKIPVTVIRERRESTFTLTMPARRGAQRGANGFDEPDDDSIEIANLGPQFHLQMEQLRKQLNSPEFHKQMEKMRQDLKDSMIDRKELQKEIEKAHREMDRAMREMQRQKIQIQIDNDDSEEN